MNKFNEGDVAMCVSAPDLTYNDKLTIGKNYTILRWDECLDMYKVLGDDGIARWWRSTRFERAQHMQPKEWIMADGKSILDYFNKKIYSEGGDTYTAIGIYKTQMETPMVECENDIHFMVSEVYTTKRRKDIKVEDGKVSIKDGKIHLMGTRTLTLKDINKIQKRLIKITVE